MAKPRIYFVGDILRADFYSMPPQLDAGARPPKQRHRFIVDIWNIHLSSSPVQTKPITKPNGLR
jgi:hypothetical protein